MLLTQAEETARNTRLPPLWHPCRHSKTRNFLSQASLSPSRRDGRLRYGDRGQRAWSAEMRGPRAGAWSSPKRVAGCHSTDGPSPSLLRVRLSSQSMEKASSPPRFGARKRDLIPLPPPLRPRFCFGAHGFLLYGEQGCFHNWHFQNLFSSGEQMWPSHSS